MQLIHSRSGTLSLHLFRNHHACIHWNYCNLSRRHSVHRHRRPLNHQPVAGLAVRTGAFAILTAMSALIVGTTKVINSCPTSVVNA